MEKDTTPRQTVRFDPDVYAELVKLARGNEHRPRASFNATLMFVLRAGLKALASETKPGNRTPARQATHV